jgi:hypothetical protein
MFNFNFKPLNDNTSGFRYNIGPFSGLARKRKTKSAWKVEQGETMVKVQLGKWAIYAEHSKPRRILWNW